MKRSLKFYGSSDWRLSASELSVSLLFIFYCIDRWLLMILNEIQNLFSTIHESGAKKSRGEKEISRSRIPTRTRRSFHLTHSWSLKFLTLSHSILDLKMPLLFPIHDSCSIEPRARSTMLKNSIKSSLLFHWLTPHTTIDLVQFSSIDFWSENIEPGMATNIEVLLLFV